MDLDLLAEADPPVPGEVERDRARGRAGRGILADTVGGHEDARLPDVPVAREAGRAGRRELLQRDEVGP